ncbi:MAG: hypothetical protein HY549_05695 [Elusimicrobia bacterium]|nr:hypothetical protein [Elusimicrobiota bacterium]
MKIHGLLRGSSSGLASIIQLDTTIGFLVDRRQVIDVSPMASSKAGYIWKRVFLRGKRPK